jgi:hypothetical protein
VTDRFAKRVVFDAQGFGDLAAGVTEVQQLLSFCGDLSGHDGGAVALARSVEAVDPFLAILGDVANEALLGDPEDP